MSLYGDQQTFVGENGNDGRVNLFDGVGLFGTYVSGNTASSFRLEGNLGSDDNTEYNFTKLAAYRGFDAYALVSNDTGAYYYYNYYSGGNYSYGNSDPSVNRLFLVETDTASVATNVHDGNDSEDLTVSLNGSGTFAYFTAWGMPGTENFTNGQMQAFFERVVDNVVLNDDGSTASYDEALANFATNSLSISLGLPSNYSIQEISTPHPDYSGITLADVNYAPPVEVTLSESDLDALRNGDGDLVLQPNTNYSVTDVTLSTIEELAFNTQVVSISIAGTLEGQDLTDLSAAQFIALTSDKVEEFPGSVHISDSA